MQEDHFKQQATNPFQAYPCPEPWRKTPERSTSPTSRNFTWGTNLNVSFTNSRGTTNSFFQSLSPQLISGFKATFTQHLLQGFGFAANTRFIRIAKNNRELSDVAFRLQIITTVDQIENMYWDLVYAYENQRVKQESLAFSQKTLSDTKKQVEIGSLAPIEAVRAQSTVAADQQALTVAKTNLQLQQLLMKNALSRTLHDPVLAGAEVIPTSTMEVPQDEPVQPTEDLVNDALRHRAELVEIRIQLNSQEISNKAVRSALLPTLDAVCLLRWIWIGGVQNPVTNVPISPLQDQVCFGCAANAPPGQIPIAPTIGYGGTLNQLVNSTLPDKGVGLQLNIPLRNRAAQAVQIRRNWNTVRTRWRCSKPKIGSASKSATRNLRVEQNRASVASAQAAVDYAKQSLDAEQKKYQFGTSTTTAVLQTRSALATAESTLMSAMAAYEKSRVELDRAVGTTARSQRHQHRRRRPRPGHADAQCSLRRAAKGPGIDHTTGSGSASDTATIVTGPMLAAPLPLPGSGAIFIFPHNSLQSPALFAKLLPLR